MEYPGARLTKPFRRAILIAFMAAFFIITPLLLMYTTGYRYDWKNGIIRETGSLSIDAVPSSAHIQLDGLPLDSSLPIQLKNITPKKYQVKITASGYYDWEKEITVERKQTTYLKDVRLLKKSDPIELLAGQINTISLSPNGRTLVYIQNDKQKAHAVLYNVKTHRTSTLLSFPIASPVRILWSNRHAFVTIAVGNPYETVLVVNSDRPTEINNVTAVNRRIINRLLWRDTSEPTLYYGTSSTLVTFYPRLREERPFTANTYHDWFVANDTLWAVTITTSSEMTILSDTLGFRDTFAVTSSSDNGFEPEKYYFENVIHEHVLLTNYEGTMRLVNSKKQFTLQTHTALISPFNSWWLFWNNSELWSYIEGEIPYLLHRSGSTLKKVAPLDTNNTLALQFDNEIKALYPYEYIQITLLNKPVKDFAVNTDARILYYSTDTGLYSLVY